MSIQNLLDQFAGSTRAQIRPDGAAQSLKTSLSNMTGQIPQRPGRRHGSGRHPGTPGQQQVGAETCRYRGHLWWRCTARRSGARGVKELAIRRPGRPGRAPVADPKHADGLPSVVRDIPRASGHAADRRFAFRGRLNNGNSGAANGWGTISVGGCLPSRSSGSRSETDKPGAPSSIPDRAVAGGCGRDPHCRTSGNARCPCTPAEGHRPADPVDVIAASRIPS